MTDEDPDYDASLNHPAYRLEVRADIKAGRILKTAELRGEFYRPD